MFLLRAQLEHLALRLAFERWTPGLYAGVAEVSAAMTHLARTAKPLGEDVWGDFSLLDARFHTRLVEASGSQALLRAWETVAPTDIIFLYDQTRSVAFVRSELEGMATRHSQLVRILESGDYGLAQAELRAHFTEASRRGTVSLDDSSLALLDWDPNGPHQARPA
jgi:DNA-binding GntR family transcriptional regulator